MTLEQVFQISQIALAVTVFLSLLIAWRQLSTYKLFELMKFLEEDDFRKARHVVVTKIGPRAHEQWWLDEKDGPEWAFSASQVCAFYDILQRLIEYDSGFRLWKPKYGRFFQQHWANSIVLNHDILSEYLGSRRLTAPDAYAGFTRLAGAARRHRIGSVTLPILARQSN